jgi:nucleoid-associated protein YgaU
VAVLLVTGVAIIARHPIARMIGTEAETTPAVPAIVATAAPAPVTGTTGTAPVGAALSAVPTHAPRDPFHALAQAGNAALAPDAAAAVGGTTAAAPGSSVAKPAAGGAPVTAKPGKTAAPATPTSTCAGTLHTVVAGDSLWTIAARAVHSTDVGRVTVAWHRIYRQNQPPLGSNPSLLPVGAKICVPDKI